jgi:hypothetical protein
LPFLACIPSVIWAQDNEQEKDIDPSKPTNLYTQFQNTAEYQRNDDGTMPQLFGYRGILSLATANQRHLGVAEIPALYNNRTEKLGLGDSRLRYFGIVYKDYSKLFGVLAPSIDLFVPSGSFENGLGSSSWSVAPGLAGGLIISPSFQTFPIVSYLFRSKPSTDQIPAAQKQVRHGLTFQAITVIKPAENWFLWITPIYIIPDLGDSSLKNQFVLEVRPSTATIAGKFQLAVFYRRNFETKANTVRAALTIFL